MAIIIPLNEWQSLTKRIDILENERKALTQTEEKEIFHSSTETASILGLHVLSFGRAKKESEVLRKMEESFNIQVVRLKNTRSVTQSSKESPFH